jgi:5-methylcytosine-specific restriction endonuclease McrBC regulatory subunit McrC
MIEVFELSLGRVLPIREISEKLLRTNSEVLETTRTKIDEYTMLFGMKPLNLEYRSEVGFVLRADSQIGYFVLDFFAIRISPKVKGLELSKVLMMAQKTNSGFLNIQNSRIQSTLVSDANFSGFELLSLSFLDCLEVVIRDGLIFGWDADEDPANSNHGQIRIDDWINTGKGLPIPRSEVGKNTNIPINRYLLKALNSVINGSSDSEVRGLALEFKVLMAGIEFSQSEESFESLTSQVLGYPREDYKKAYIFARALLEGGRFDEESGHSAMPSFVLNLDVIFEQYCAFMLNQILDSELYEVEVQNPYSHDSRPEMAGVIQPDIVIRNSENSKCVVVDTKNKSVFFESGKAANLPNQDIYQLVYYAQRLEAECAVLLYPGVKALKTFPIQGSESPEDYDSKIDRFMDETSDNRFLVFPKSAKVNLAPWQVDLSGNLENTELSIISLAFFIGKILE